MQKTVYLEYTKNRLFFTFFFRKLLKTRLAPRRRFACFYAVFCAGPCAIWLIAAAPPPKASQKHH
jgi:hypothetical protein